MFYAFIIIDVSQGIALSFVFCYSTPEGKEIVAKHLRNRNGLFWILRCARLCGWEVKDDFYESGYRHTGRGDSDPNDSGPGRLERTSRTDIECNGCYNDVIELNNMDGTRASSQF